MSSKNKLYDDSIVKLDSRYTELSLDNAYIKFHKDTWKKTRVNDRSYHGYTKNSTVFLIVALVVVVAAILSAGSGILVYLITNEGRECKNVIPEKKCPSTMLGPTDTTKMHEEPTTQNVPNSNATSTTKQATLETGMKTTTTTTHKVELSTTEPDTTKELTFTSGITTAYPSTELQCPSEWLMLASSCYYFSKTLKKWTDAERACRNAGGRLVEIYDNAKGSALRSQAMVLRSNFWIGLTDQKTEGVWVWYGSNTTVTSGMYTNWSPGQPDDGSRSEDCALISRSFSYWWNDDQCYNSHKYICEKDNK